ncbi:hypothetical protein [Micromonospora sp. DH14]|uniref:hypothetical protein n=1 Tax=Micromonospora sp. DH14 TaxID=3040120 RepID=UPI002442C3AA|nr:hypothetical protein [Micromonospora sp. DH14]MDG9674717.1 hypothetical protein [Micromonospora sp. DH14]
MLFTAESSSVNLSDHGVQGRGWMHDKHATIAVRRQQQPVARLEAAPFSNGCRQMKMTLTRQGEDALRVQTDDDEPGALVNMKTGIAVPSESANDHTISDPATDIDGSQAVDRRASPRDWEVRQGQWGTPQCA